MKVLVINSGSSSLKAQLMDTVSGEVFCSAYCERIGQANSFMTYKTSEKHVIEVSMPTHKEAFKEFLSAMTDKKVGVISSLDEIGAIGHRLVNFGEKYNKSVVVTPKILEDLKKNIKFAPLHNPPAILGLEACIELMPKVKNVAVFDTAFHSTMEEKAYIYAIP